MKKIIIVCLLAAAMSMAQRQRVAVLPSIADPETKFSARELDVLTEKLRGYASDILPLADFVLLKQDYVKEKLGDEALFKACEEGTCVGDLVAMVQADFGARCDVFGVKGKLWLKFELYGTLRGDDEAGTISTFSEEVKDLKAMEAAIKKMVPDAFRKILLPKPAPSEEEDAEAYYKRGAEYIDEEDYDNAISELTEAIRLNPKYAEAYSKRGLAYAIKGEHDIAMFDANEAIRLKPKYAEAYYVRGRVYGNKKNYDKAISEFTQAIRLEPKYAYAYNWRGVAYHDKKNYDKAIADHTQAIRLEPNYAYAYYNRGGAYYNKRNYDKAMSDFDEAIRLDPDYAVAYYSRGASYHAKGDYDNAISNYYEAIRLDPNDAKAYYWRGVAYSEKEDYDNAISDYSEAIRLNPKDAAAYYNRGNAYSEKEDYDNAISDFNEVIGLNPKYAAAYYLRGWAYGRKGDYDRAISNFNEAIRLNPKYAAAYYLRGVAYENKGDYNRAIADYKSALRIDPNFSNAQEALENISSTAAGGTKGRVFTDSRDGKKYRTVKIGSQTWMAENLNYNASGSRCYSNNSGYCAKYGRLYDWATTMALPSGCNSNLCSNRIQAKHRGICPSGWHIPSDADWDELMNAAGGKYVAGKKLKAKSGWYSNGNGTDEFGFSALPGGIGSSGGSFDYAGYYGYWWSASEYSSGSAYLLDMNYYTEFAIWDNDNKSFFLFSVRCVQD